MIDKRSRIGKMIDYNKVVYMCLRCNRRFVGDANTRTDQCPMCIETEGVQLVIVDNLVVRK